MKKNITLNFAVTLVVFLLFVSGGIAQKKKDKKISKNNAVMWEKVNIKQRDLYHGPGGKEMMPDLSKITYIKEEKSGHNTKYRIKDGKGRVWVAKLGREAQPETAAVRLMWAIGYKSEINYLVPQITIPGKGTFQNVRLEARPEYIDRKDEWSWKENPFVGTNEFQGLKIMMVFLKNWDVLDIQNKVLEVDTKNGREYHYIISDLGATFGRLGNNNLPIFYRLGRSVGKPRHYAKTILIRNVEDDEVELSYKGKNRWIWNNISVSDVKWLYGLLSQLSDKQIRDAFRAAGYDRTQIEILTGAVKDKIAEMAEVAEGENLALKR